MTARTIKTREEILRTVKNLQEDLYFSFGVPEFEGDGAPEFDPLVAVHFPNQKAFNWANRVAGAVSCLRGSFLPESEREMPQPKLPEQEGTRRYVKGARGAFEASRPKHLEPRRAKCYVKGAFL